jgi:hypothetical protein
LDRGFRDHASGDSAPRIMNINSFVGGCCAGGGGRSEHPPLSELAWQSGGGAASRLSRSSTYPPASRFNDSAQRTVAVGSGAGAPRCKNVATSRSRRPGAGLYGAIGVKPALASVISVLAACHRPAPIDHHESGGDACDGLKSRVERSKGSPGARHKARNSRYTLVFGRSQCGPGS